MPRGRGRGRRRAAQPRARPIIQAAALPARNARGNPQQNQEPVAEAPTADVPRTRGRKRQADEFLDMPGGKFYCLQGDQACRFPFSNSEGRFLLTEQIAAKINQPMLDETQDDRGWKTNNRSKGKGRGKKEKGKNRQVVGGYEQSYTSLQSNVPDRYSSLYGHSFYDEPLSVGQAVERSYQQPGFSSPGYGMMQSYYDENRTEEYTMSASAEKEARGYPGLNKPRNIVPAKAATQTAARMNQQLWVSEPNSGMMQQQNDQMNISKDITEDIRQASGVSRQTDLQYASDVVKDVFCTPCGDDGSKEAVSKYCPECEEYLCLACTRCHQRMKATRDHVLTELQPEDHGYTMVIEKCCYHPNRNIEMYCRTHDMVYCTRCIATEHRSCTGVTDIENAAEDENCTIREVQKLQDEMKVFYDQLEMCNKKKESARVATEEQCSDISVKIKAVKREMTNHIEKLERDAMDALKKTKAEIKNELETDMSNVNKMIGTVEERSKKMERAAHMDNVQKFVQVKLSQEVAKDVRNLHEENKAKREKTISCTVNEQISKDFMKMQYICKISTFEQ